jgi:beta-glucosidase
MLDDFLFGAATSAYQIEGAWDDDGKVPSIWDDISHKGDVILNGQTGDVACNHYYLWKDDLALISNLGIGAYRFSTSWSRVIVGPGASNPKGINFYKNIIKGLKNINVEPFVTLYHWDLPSWLNENGGWADPNTVEEFVRYAELMFKELPEVKYWITFNEPAVFISNRWGHNDANKAIRNVLIAHGKVAKLYKKKYDGKIGISLNLRQYSSFDKNNDADNFATKKADMVQNRIWLDPIYKGDFPKGINTVPGFKLSLSIEEKKMIKGSADFLGINYYGGGLVKHDEDEGFRCAPIPNAIADDMGFIIYPFGLYLLMDRLKKDYKNPEMYITENGCCYSDTVLHDGSIPDKQRQDYIRMHLKYCNKAIEQGVNLKGYFYWSLMDNFEWTMGYSKRFGLIYIDYPSLKRIPKESYEYYWKIIKDKEFRAEALK